MRLSNRLDVCEYLQKSQKLYCTRHLRYDNNMYYFFPIDTFLWKKKLTYCYSFTVVRYKALQAYLFLWKLISQIMTIL